MRSQWHLKQCGWINSDISKYHYIYEVALTFLTKWYQLNLILTHIYRNIVNFIIKWTKNILNQIEWTNNKYISKATIFSAFWLIDPNTEIYYTSTWKRFMIKRKKITKKDFCTAININCFWISTLEKRDINSKGSNIIIDSCEDLIRKLRSTFLNDWEMSMHKQEWKERGLSRNCSA